MDVGQSWIVLSIVGEFLPGYSCDLDCATHPGLVHLGSIVN